MVDDFLPILHRLLPIGLGVMPLLQLRAQTKEQLVPGMEHGLHLEEKPLQLLLLPLHCPDHPLPRLGVRRSNRPQIEAAAAARGLGGRGGRPTASAQQRPLERVGGQVVAEVALARKVPDGPEVLPSGRSVTQAVHVPQTDLK